MKKVISLLPAVLLGAVGFLLRWSQVRSAFDAQTGLAVPSVLHLLLAVWVVVTAVLLALWFRKMPKIAEGAAAAFRCPDGAELMVLIGGAFLYLAAGAWQILGAETGFAWRLLGALGVLAGVSLLAAVFQWRRGGQMGNLLLVPVLLNVMWLLVTYRNHADDPVTERYFLPILAMAALTYAFFQLAALCFSAGRRRRALVFAALALALSIAALGDAGDLAELGYWAGGILSMGGFLLCARGPEEVPEEEEEAEE